MAAGGLRRCAAGTRSLLGVGGEEQLDVQLLPEFRASKQEWQTKNLKCLTLLSLVVALYYMFASGFETPQHTFVRINNCTTVFFSLFSYILKTMIGNGCLRSCPVAGGLRKGVVCLGVLHYAAYITMTWERVQKLLSYVTDAPVVPMETDAFSEPYVVMFCAVGIFACSFFHILTTTGLLVLAIFAPCQWAVQCALLGTSLGWPKWLKLAGIFVSACAIAFMGGRRSNIEYMNSFMRLHMERLQVLRIFRQASVPIFIVGPDPESSSGLRVELWNSALEELTQTSVPYGTDLNDVNCLRSSSNSALLNAIRWALSNGVRTQRMLVPVVTAAGVVWLQVTASPVSSDGAKAIVIGSDVTEFVGRHVSLLHFVPEDGPGERQCERRLSEAEPGQCVAELDPHALTVLECSSHFNILLQCRMRGRPFLQYISEEDRGLVRQAAQVVLAGTTEQVLRVGLRPVCPGCPEGSQRRRGQRRGKQQDAAGGGAHKASQGGKCRECRGRALEALEARAVSLRLALVRESGVGQGSIRLTVAPEGGAAGSGKGSCRSDPGPDFCTRGNTVAACTACQARSEASADVDHGAAAEREGALPGRHRADQPKIEALMIHLIDLARHLNIDTFQESHQLLQVAMQRIRARSAESTRRWGSPCRHWRCSLCNALNDKDDEICEVCKLGEPEDKHSSDDDTLYSPKPGHGRMQL